MSPERKLFQAIVAQCFIDAVCNLPTPLNYASWSAGWHKRRTKAGLEPSTAALSAAWMRARTQHRAIVMQIERDRKEARQWLTTPGRDFQLICALAGFDMDYIYDNAKKLELRGWTSDAPIRLAA